MAAGEGFDRDPDGITGITASPDAIVDLTGAEPVIDLRADPSGPIVGRSPAATGAYERRDATQQARFIAVVVIAVLNALDLVTTYAAISAGAREGNPLVSWAIASPLVAVAKVLVCGSLIVGAAFAKRSRRLVSLPALCAAWAVVGIYSLVVLLNLLNFLSHR